MPCVLLHNIEYLHECKFNYMEGSQHDTEQGHIQFYHSISIQNMLFGTDYIKMRGVYRSSPKPPELLTD